jgi:hypothetical protein
MLLRDTLTDRAETAPNGAGLLSRVHTRSRLIRRRRRVGAAGAGVAAVLLGVAGVPVVTGLLPAANTPAGVGGPATTRPIASEATPEPRGSGAPTSPPPPFTAVLGPPEFTTPTVPFTAPAGVVDGLAPGVAMYDGRAMIMHAPEKDGDPLLMLHIDAKPDGFAQGDPEPVRVRGVDGSLTRLTDPAHPGMVVSWTEPDGTPMVISAGNLTVDEVVAYANALTRTDSHVAVPFSFTVLPRGMELDNVGPSNMVFKVPGQASTGDFVNKLGFFLNADGGQDAASWPLTVGGRKAAMSPQDDGGRTLMVSQPNGWVLAVQVPVNVTISDDDLFRLAAGVTVTGSARAGRG